MEIDIFKYLKPKKEEEKEIEKFNEIEFQKTYKEMATKMGLNLDPDNPLHYYDWRALYKETKSLTPDGTGHFPSKYKLEGHPDMYVEGVKTKEEEKPGVEQRKRGIGEIDISKYIVPKGEAKTGAGAKAKETIKLEETRKEEPNVFDTLNESIEKNYKQYQNITKKLETYQAEYDYAPDSIKPSIAANFNKLVGQNNDLLKQLQSDIGERDQIITTINKANFMKYKQLTGLPGGRGISTPLPQPKPIIEGLPISALEKPEPFLEKVKKGVVSVFGTWEAKKKAMPELQKMEDLASTVISEAVPLAQSRYGEDYSKRGSAKEETAIIHEYLTGASRLETLDKMDANFKEHGSINPDVDERTWLEYYKQEGLWKTLITGPTKGIYDEAEKLQRQLSDIRMRVAEPGKDFIGQVGWAGMAIVLGYQGINALYKGGMVIENKIIKGEKLKQAVERIQKAYISETGKFKSSLSNNDFRIATALNQVVKRYGKEVLTGLTRMEVPQEMFMLRGQAGNIANLVKMIQSAGKITPDIANQLKVMNRVDAGLVFQQLSMASPGIASKVATEFREAKIIPEEFEIQAIEEEVTVSLEEEGKVEAIWTGEDIGGTLEEIKEGTLKAFEKTSEFLYAKPFKELSKPELRKVLETSKQALPDSTGEYINKIGTPAKGLEIRPTADEHARFIFGGFEKGILTDSHLLVLDKEVSKAVLSDLIEKYKKARIKEVQSEEISYKEAQKIVDKEVEEYKKEFVKQFPDTEKIVSEEDVKKSAPLYLQGHQITELGPPITILTDGKIQIAVDTNKLAFLNKHFPDAEIKSTGQNKPVLFIEGGKLKAMVMPVTVEKYPFKITGEPTIRKPAEKVEPTIISKVGPTVRPTKPKTYDIKADLTPEQRVEGNKLMGQIHKILGQKKLTNKEFVSLKQKYGLSPHLATATRRMTIPQLQAVLKAMERARPKRIGYQEVITRKTEGKIQSLKDSLIEKYQMTEQAYQDTLKDLGIYKEPRYIDGKHFITEEKGKELIYRLIDESNILKITEPLRVALEKNPEIKKLADVIDERVRLEGERTLKDPSDLNSARSYFQILETISGAPFFTLYQDLINCHLENRADLNHLIEGFDEYRDIIKDEKELKKVENWILAKSNLEGRPETPVDMTPKEIELAKKIEGILKDYQARARTEKFLDNLEHLEKMPDYLKYKKEIDKAKDIYESKGYDALVEYMKDQEFGIIKSGYDPLQVVSARIRTAYKAKGLSMLFGKEHIKVRKDIEYKEQDINIITRLISYKRQMDNLSAMAPKVRALITLANKNLSKFKNPSRVKSNLQAFFRELKGYDRSAGWWERGINRLYAQAMTTIIMGSPPLSFRNLGQNFGLGHDKVMLVDPRNKKLTPDEIVYLDTFVQQAIFMRTDWFMTGEKPLPGLTLLTNIIKKINLYPRSDVANRHWGFWGKINQVRMAFEADVPLAEKMEKAKFSDFSLLEQKRALEILAKDGQEAMEKYVAKIYVDDVHFLYERAQRSLAEMGPYGKVFGNLMLFPRAYWEKLTKMSKKMTGKDVPFMERARAFKVISSILIGGSLVGVAYTKTTGRRKPPYDPLVLLAYQTGGLMIGTVEALNDVYVETINAVRGDKRALATLTSSVPALADHLIPFYNYTLRGYEAFLGDPLVNKNIDVYALKKLRQLVDKEYQIRGGVHSVERSAIEKWQYFLSGAGVDVAIREREKKEKEEVKKFLTKPSILIKPKKPKLTKPSILTKPEKPKKPFLKKP